MLFSAGQEVILKNYGTRSCFYLLTVFKHGLLEGLTFLFQYSFITHTKLESSRLGKFKYAISAGYDVRLQNKSLRKGKKSTFYDRLPEATLLLFRYSYSSRAPLDSSPLGEQKYAISMR